MIHSDKLILDLEFLMIMKHILIQLMDIIMRKMLFLMDTYIYKLNTPQFNIVNRSGYGNGCNFKRHSIEYRGKGCYIPFNGYSFIRCINFLTGFD